MKKDNDLLNNLEKIHSTELGILHGGGIVMPKSTIWGSKRGRYVYCPQNSVQILFPLSGQTGIIARGIQNN
jgi:hypothetical protein